MTLLVPFDGSDLAMAALQRATEFSAVFDEPIVAVTVVPDGNTEYARSRGWLEADEQFDDEEVHGYLRDAVASLAPTASVRIESVGRDAPAGTISNRVRKVAREVDASMVFVGSDNAGHMVTSLSSVGGAVAADGSYDVVIVRERTPSRIDELRAATSESGTGASFARDS